MCFALFRIRIVGYTLINIRVFLLRGIILKKWKYIDPLTLNKLKKYLEYNCAMFLPSCL